jgi:acyl-CoA synthetase (AMP-forming)/AMP-acid ligase II
MTADAKSNAGTPSSQQTDGGHPPAGSLSIPCLLEMQAKEGPQEVAIAAPGRAPLTFKGLWKQIEYTVETLNTLGIGRNDRIAIVLPNGPEMAAAFLAVASGATSAPLNPSYGIKEFDFYLADLEAKALVIQSGMESPAREAAKTRDIPIIDLSFETGSEAGTFTLTGEQHTSADQGGLSGPEDVALILHTSGTTSRPKMVPLAHANLCTSARNIRQAFGLGGEDRCLNVMPLFHIHGLIGAVLSSLISGASIVCTPGFSAAEFFQWMEEFRPTWYTAVPTMHQSILKNAPANKDIIARHPLRFIRSCSASLPPNVMAELERTFKAPVVESYGMTEASHQMTSNPLPPQPRKPGSVGLPTGPEVAIMNQAGDFLLAGETAEIVIRGENVTRGYLNNPSANESSFVDGWFRTGDQGYLDPDGYLFITGRIKEIINRGGEKIAPREIDEALMEHPAITQAVAFAVPHTTLGEDVAVAIVLQKNASVTEKEIREYAFSQMADHKVPSQVLIVDEIPKGPTGKLQRIGLAEKLADKLKAKYVAPRNPIEEILSKIWTEVLGIEQVGVHDNFFTLGGDSLSAARVVSRVIAAFHVEPSLEAIFRAPTVADQSLVIEDMLLEEIEQLSEEEAQGLVDQGE